MAEGHAESIYDRCYCHIQHRACQAACAAGRRAFIATAETRIGGFTHVSAVHTEALAWCGKTCRWMSAPAGVPATRYWLVWDEE